MRCPVGEIEEEWVALMTVDERTGEVGDQVQVVSTASLRCWFDVLASQVHIPKTCRVAVLEEDMVKAMPMDLIRWPQMPLSRHAGNVAGVLQSLGYGPQSIKSDP